MSRVLGCRRSNTEAPVSPMAIASTAHVARLGAAYADIDLRKYVDRVRDQSDRSECTGESTAAACHIAAKRKGLHASHRGLYVGGRARERARHGSDLTDDGAMIADVLAYAIEEGIYPEDDRDDVTARINDESTWDEVEAQVQLERSAVERIPDRDRLDHIIASLHEEAPVVFGMLVDQAYMDLGSTPYPGLTGRSLGAHAQVIVGYVNGLFIVLGSWSPQWGAFGYGLFEPSALEEVRDEVFDFYRVKSAPVLVAT